MRQFEGFPISLLGDDTMGVRIEAGSVQRLIGNVEVSHLSLQRVTWWGSSELLTLQELQLNPGRFGELVSIRPRVSMLGAGEWSYGPLELMIRSQLIVTITNTSGAAQRVQELTVWCST